MNKLNIGTSEKPEGAMYRKEPKVYPREVDGRYARLRRIAAWLLLGLFYSICWLPWGDQQAILFDLPQRRFHVFSLTLWPQDFIYLALLLVAAAMALFFFTALAGRLWCGYACPQTVWTELFLWAERLLEGDRRRRIKLDQSSWSATKLLRKTGKQIVWVALAVWTGFTFVGYFSPIRELGVNLVTLRSGPWETFWVLFYAFATYANAAYLREQVCKYMCPYARFQSAMFDRDTLVIAYDSQRGEPRGKRRRGEHDRQLGSCIDCTLCVQVCPTGIDIRQGLQIECIACAACIDVCDQVMARMDYPPGLIRYTTDHELQGTPWRLGRPRVWVYGGLLCLLVSSVIFGLAQRTPLRLEVLRDRNALYRVVDAVTVENVYTLRLINMDQMAHRYQLEVSGVEGLDVVSEDIVRLAAGEAKAIPVRLRAPSAAGSGGQDIHITVAATDSQDLQVVRPSKFFLPIRPSP